MELYSAKAFTSFSDNAGEALLPEEEPRDKPTELKASRQFVPRVG